MCDPITLTSIALTGAGAASNYAALGDVAAARSGVLSAERGRQAALNAEGDKVNAQSLDRFTDFGTKKDARATQLSDYFKQPDGTTPTAPPAVMPTSNSTLVNNEVANKSGIAKAWTNQQGDALGKMRSFGDVLAEDNRGLARDSGSIAQLSGFKKGSADATAYELDNANNAGNGLAFLGNILGGLGKVGLSAGLSGGSSKIASMFGPGNPIQLASAGAPGTVGSFGTNFTGTGVNPFQIY